MPVRVLIPPAPFMTPAHVPGSHAPGDPVVAAMIAAVVAQFDGPDGTLGRCFGEQTLEMSFDRLHVCGDRLPYPPFIGDVVVNYLDLAGVSQTVVPADYAVYRDVFRLRAGYSFVSLGSFPYPITVTYKAGYNGTPVKDGGTGDVPPQVKQAVVLMVQHLKSLGVENLFLRSEEVEGVGTFQYTVSEQAGNIIRDASKRLLSGLKVPRI